MIEITTQVPTFKCVFGESVLHVNTWSCLSKLTLNSHQLLNSQALDPGSARNMPALQPGRNISAFEPCWSKSPSQSDSDPVPRLEWTWPLVWAQVCLIWYRDQISKRLFQCSSNTFLNGFCAPAGTLFFKFAVRHADNTKLWRKLGKLSS